MCREMRGLVVGCHALCRRKRESTHTPRQSNRRGGGGGGVRRHPEHIHPFQGLQSPFEITKGK